MKQGTKQRIVGTVVLLALALIFLPIIFDGEGSYQNDISSRIPARPLIPRLAEPMPTRPVIIADTAAIEIIQTPATDDSEPVLDNSDTAVSAVADSAASNEELATGVEVSASEPVFVRAAPPLASNGLPQAWSVRLGSFSDSDNAENLLERLQQSGYKAYSRGLDSSQGMLTAVFVGPWVDRDRVDEYQKELLSEFQLAGLIVRYEVEPL